MSPVMTFRIAFKALGRNKMRTGLTMLGMIIGVSAVITLVAMGNGAHVGDRGSDQGRRHQHDHGQRRQLLAGRRARRRGHVERAHRRRTPRRSATRCPGVQYLAAGVRTAGAGGRRQPELVHAHPGHRRRPAAHPRVADAMRQLLQPAGRVGRRQGRRARQDGQRHSCSAPTPIRSARSSASATSRSGSSA